MTLTTKQSFAVIIMTCILAGVFLPFSAHADDAIGQTGTGASEGAAATQGPAPQPAMAILYVYRTDRDNAYHSTTVRLDSEPAVEIAAGAHVMWRLTPGRHSVGTDDDSYSFEAQAGETYYLHLDADRGLWGNWRHPLLLVTAAEGQQAVAGTTLMAERKQEVVRPREQVQPVATAGTLYFSPTLFAGIGDTDVDIGTTTTGDPVRISGGGGFGYGLAVGYGLTRNFDLEFTVGSQLSTETPEVMNANAEFKRTFLLITMKYGIPMFGYTRIRLGAGAGYYMPGDLVVDTSLIAGGSYDVVSYDNAVGFHGTAEWEIFVKPHLSFAIGGKYYHVVYEETGGTRNGVPGFFTDEKIKNFDGSGLDISLCLTVYLP